MQYSKRMVFVGKEVDWTKSRAGLSMHSESEERDKISVKKEGTKVIYIKFSVVLWRKEEAQCRRESKQWVENCANAPNLLLVSLVVLSEFISLTLFHGDVQTMFFSETEPHRLGWVRLLTQHS